MKNSFEKIIKEKLEQISFDYDPQDWEAIKGNLNKPNYLKYYIGAAVVVLAISVGILYSNLDTQTNIAKNKQDNKVEVSKDINTIAHKENKQNNKIATKKDFNNKKSIIPDKKKHTQKNNDIHQAPITPFIKKDNLKDEKQDAVVSNKKQINKQTNVEADSKNVIELNLSPQASKNIVCLGDTLYFSNKAQAGVEYYWSFGDKEHNKGAKVSHFYKKYGNYTVKLTAYKQSDKSQKKVSYLDIEVKDIPKADFTWKNEGSQHNGNKLYYPYTNFESSLKGNGTNKWEIQGKVYSGATASVIFEKKGSYTVKHTYIDNNNCSNSVTKRIETKTPFQPYAPNAFTPNGDGTNDTFLPKELETFSIPFTMIIYNEKQEIVFQTSSADAPWNGRKMNTGRLMKQSTYFWVLTTQDHKNVSHTFKGTILLLP